MAQRALVLREEYGLYTVVNGGATITGRTPERALEKLFKSRTGFDLEVRNTGELNEVLETLLGPKTADPEAAVAP